MEYLALIYSDERRWDEATDAERAAGYEKYAELANAARAAGVLVGGEELPRRGRPPPSASARASSSSPTACTPRRRRRSVAATSRLPLVRRCPGLGGGRGSPPSRTGAVEVRPVHAR